MLQVNGECHNLFFFFIWSPALSFCRKQNWKGNPCEHPRSPPDSGWGSEGLCCTSAKLLKCRVHSALPWDSSVSITYTDKAEESFSLRQMAGGLRNKNVKKWKNLRLSSEVGALVWRRTDRQAIYSKCIWLHVWPGAYMGHSAGCAVWLICLGLLLLCSLRKHLFSGEFCPEILLAACSQCPALWLPAACEQMGLAPVMGSAFLHRSEIAWLDISWTGKEAENAEDLLHSPEHENQKTFWTTLVCPSVFFSQHKFSQSMRDNCGGYPVPKRRHSDHLRNTES